MLKKLIIIYIVLTILISASIGRCTYMVLDEIEDKGLTKIIDSVMEGKGDKG